LTIRDLGGEWRRLMHTPGRRAALWSVMRFGRITEADAGPACGSEASHMQPKCINAEGSASTPVDVHQGYASAIPAGDNA
jgi:hypothetical protein